MVFKSTARTEKLRISAKAAMSIIKQHLERVHPDVEIISVGPITTTEIGIIKGRKKPEELPVFKGVTIKVAA